MSAVDEKIPPEMADWVRHIREKTGRADYPIKNEIVYETVEERKKRQTRHLYCLLCPNIIPPRAHTPFCKEHQHEWLLHQRRRQAKRAYQRQKLVQLPEFLGS